MSAIDLDINVYQDKVAGCWLGKTIGGTLGAPYEGIKRRHSLTFYDPVPTEALPNDDLDLQLVWLRMLEDLEGRLPTLSDFAAYWMKYLRAWPPDEYGFSLRNLERGLRPPISGLFENRDIDCMGAPIRSEIWACLMPANPQAAAALASRDAVLDHSGGEGIYGEMFWAAVESAAFVIDDPCTLIRIGLAMIPMHSHIARAVRDVLWCYENGRSCDEAYDRIVGNFATRHRGVAYAHPCLAAPNHAFTIIGLLYGKDFGDQLCVAVNCGFDADCTGATLGSVLGILLGAEKIPAKWEDPIGQILILDPRTGDCGAPKDIDELTRRTVKLGISFVERYSDNVSLCDEKNLPENLQSLMFRNDEARKTLAGYDFASAVETVGNIDITLHYNGEPVLHPDIEKSVNVSVAKEGENVEEAEVILSGPSGWKIVQAGPQSWRLSADEVPGRNRLTVKAVIDGEAYSADFTLLGPEEARGYDLYWGVPRCEVCKCRVEACTCD